jgi:mycothiol synthase
MIAMSEGALQIREVRGEAEIEAFLAIRAAVDPANPMTREAWDDERDTAGRIDLLAWQGTTAVGCAFAERTHGDPSSSIGWISVRVLEGHRRLGHGTALLRRVSEHVSSFGGTSLIAGATSTAVEILAFLAHHGFEEVGRMQDVELELAGAYPSLATPQGIVIVPLTAELDAGAHAVALEADADIPTSNPIVTGDLERWRQRNLGSLAERELSFAALAGTDVVGFAILGRAVPGVLEHYMTGVRRDFRGRGIAQALKRTQIVAAKEAGYERLRTQNDLANAAMRRVNERLGYRARLEWVHLAGPLVTV